MHHPNAKGPRGGDLGPSQDLPALVDRGGASPTEPPAGTTRRLPPRDNIISLSGIRLIRDREGAWLVVTPKGSGWAHADLQSALEDMRWLDRNWRGWP
jgi:hypothetical protein